MSEEKSYYKLGPNAGSFNDPAQSENKSLLPGQVLPLEETNRVERALAAKGLKVAKKSEYDAYLKKQKKRDEELAAKQSASLASSESANKILDTAKKQFREAEAKAVEAQKLKEEAETKAKEVEEILNDPEKLRARLAELEADSGKGE